MTTPSRQEVDAAFRTYLKLGAETHDWNAWADLFTDDALYVEVQYGTFHGRAADEGRPADQEQLHPAPPATTSPAFRTSFGVSKAAMSSSGFPS